MRKYPDAVRLLEKDLAYLLNFYHAPLSARRSIYTTNLLERAIKEFRRRRRRRRRIKIIDSMPSPDTLEKLIFLMVMEYNSIALQDEFVAFLPGLSLRKSRRN